MPGRLMQRWTGIAWMTISRISIVRAISEDLAARLEWDSARKLSELRAGRPRSKRNALRVHGEGRVRFFQRRRRLAVFATQSAGDVSARPGGTRKRFSDCYIWAVVLDSRRYDAAAAA